MTPFGRTKASRLGRSGSLWSRLAIAAWSIEVFIAAAPSLSPAAPNGAGHGCCAWPFDCCVADVLVSRIVNERGEDGHAPCALARQGRDGPSASQSKAVQPPPP